MKPPLPLATKLSRTISVFLLIGAMAWPALAQAPSPAAEKKIPAEVTTVKAPATVATPDAVGDTNAPAASAATASPDKGISSTNQTSSLKADKPGSPDEIQISFQGANVDMIVQWLAQTTGKSVVKHPQVQCQLTIMSSKKLANREGINLVYRALALEGVAAVESSNTIMLVPEGKEPKLNPELLDGSQKGIPDGRQRLVKMFRLAYMQAADLREKVRGLISEKGTMDVDERANQLIVTDYNDNLRLLADIIREFDVPASGLMLEIYPL